MQALYDEVTAIGATMIASSTQEQEMYRELMMTIFVGAAAISASAYGQKTPDPYSDGAKSGKVDPYTDGAKSGTFDPYTDGANKLAGRSDGGPSAAGTTKTKRDPYTEGANQGKRDTFTDGARTGSRDPYTDGARSK
ncbi:hypothetical protein [Cupriavidus sp. amp6]|uniref:hypothetical protein n=1 Tax=Cupriavidus sp. amp6 TaxID=388051 RepID=UPI00350EA281